MANGQLEHGKNYIVTMIALGSFDALNFLASSVKFSATGGAIAVNQKGRQMARSFKGQPTVTCDIRLFATEPDLNVVINNSVLNNELFHVSVYKKEVIEEAMNELGELEKVLKDPSKVILEMVGYINTVNIVAEVGNFMITDISFIADDIAKFDPNNLDESGFARSALRP